MTKQNKRILLLLVMLCTIVLLSGCGNITLTKDGSTPIVNETGEELKVHFLDVGQGDAVLIQHKEYSMLIDAGDNQYGQKVVDYLKDQGVEKLAYVIGTHPHADHIGGLDDVIRAFDVEKVIMPKVAHTSKTFEDVLTAIQEKGLKVTSPKVGDTYTLGKANWTILAPNKESYINLNNYSVVIRLVFGETSFVFTGDAEELSEKEMLSSKQELKANVLKVGHHGSTSSTSEEFLKAVSPGYAVIQVGSDNKYGHPHIEVQERLDKWNSIVYRTDEEGTIIATSNGQVISFQTDKNGVKKEANTNVSKSEPTPIANPIYIGNKNSKIFHLEVCRSLPVEHNRIFFDSREDAIKEGLDPCQICKP